MMFHLRVHSVDSNQPLSLEEDAPSPPLITDTAQSSHDSYPKYIERRGMVHLYRATDPNMTSTLSAVSTSLFILAIPSYFSATDFIRFCGTFVEKMAQLLFIRNDGIEDRYSALVKLENQSRADEFYKNFNGKRFSLAEVEVCHVLFDISVHFTESAEEANSPIEGYTELPTCPICLERLDPEASGILTTPCDHSFQCACTSKWTYLSCQVCRLFRDQEEKPGCSVCGTPDNLWVCLICGFMGCGRYKEGHAIRHWQDMRHCYSLDLSTQQIWDYVGDSYVHRLNQSKVEAKLVDPNSQFFNDGDCGSFACDEDTEVSEALYCSKVEAIADEYNHLLATQLEIQRQHYESLIIEAKHRQESQVAEAVEKTKLEMRNVQNELEKCEKERNAVADANRDLIKDQDALKKRANEIEEKERLQNERLHDLEEQTRDLTMYLKAKQTIANMGDVDSIKGGTLLPVPLKQTSSTKARRHGKPTRRSN